MQLKESHAIILLLSIILFLLIIKPKEVNIPVNTVTIIERHQTPIFPPRLESEKQLVPDTSTFVNSTKNSNFGKKWMKRYKSGIRFEFYPPN